MKRITSVIRPIICMAVLLFAMTTAVMGCYRGVMTALPRAACIMPTIRGAWQIGWIFSNGQAERLRRYSPLCYVAPILPAQPPLKVRYHALTAFPVSAFM